MPVPSLRRRQIAIVALLFVGYASLYFCRADLSVATPLLIDELRARGLSQPEALLRIGTITSLGTAGYAVGKLFLGGLGDFWGGRINFLIGLAGATVFTVLFAVTGLIPIFTLAWVGNRLTQSLSWAGLIKVSSKWFNFSSYGTLIGILSVSFLVGDAAARQLMGMLIHHGFGWRALFYFAAGVAAACLAINFLFLRESRAALGFEEARTNPLNLFSQSESRPASVAALLRPLFRSPAFQLVCLLSFTLTIVRETFNNWTPEYLHAYLGYSAGDAGSMSAIFPGVGAVSVLVTGWLSDRLGVNGRALLMFIGLITATVALFALMSVPSGAGTTLIPLLAIGGVAFCLLGPYSYLGGAFALDFGGKQGSAVASGIIDGIGYLGGILAGTSVTQISTAFGWQGVFVALAAVTALAAIGAGFLYALRFRAAAIQQTAQ
ncbi:MAG TPA: MFS transporter [Steroidobacteraceae bacterium]|nr:MFS transporter [Steroidobacteraceae bacterium]